MNILTNNTEKVYKYYLEKLGCGSDEYIIVKDFFVNTTVNLNYSGKSLPDFNVYEIMETCPIKSLKEEHNNLILFHGTSNKGVE